MHTINLTDIVRAKFFKACGERAEEVGDLQGAVGYYESALQYSDKSASNPVLPHSKNSLKAEIFPPPGASLRKVLPINRGRPYP